MKLRVNSPFIRENSQNFEKKNIELRKSDGNPPKIFGLYTTNDWRHFGYHIVEKKPQPKISVEQIILLREFSTQTNEKIKISSRWRKFFLVMLLLLGSTAYFLKHLNTYPEIVEDDEEGAKEIQKPFGKRVASEREVYIYLSHLFLFFFFSILY